MLNLRVDLHAIDATPARRRGGVDSSPLDGAHPTLSTQVEKEQYQLKPMNCPFHCLVFKDQLRSYRDLPYRWAELGTVYRYERSGTLQGLMRVRGFTQDDAHIFCTPDQLEDEIVDVLELTQEILTKFGFVDYELMLSTRPYIKTNAVVINMQVV